MKIEEFFKNAFHKVKNFDVRLVCELKEGSWFIKRVNITRFSTIHSVPGRVNYTSLMFLRSKMNLDKCAKFIDDLQKDNGKYVWGNMDLNHRQLAFDNEVNHLPGRIQWGIKSSKLPCWVLNGSWKDQHSTEPYDGKPLIGLDSGSPYFPSNTEGEAWFLFGSVIDRHMMLPTANISITDNGAYFDGIDIEGDKYTVRCKGINLSSCKIQLYTSAFQLESKPAKKKNVFILTGKPDKISFILTDSQDWLDRRDIDLTGLGGNLPDDINLVYSDSTLAIKELIARRGENSALEFKEKLNDVVKEKDRFLQSIVAFLNTQGGHIILGVNDNGMPVGVDTNDTKDRIINRIEDYILGSPKVEIFPIEIDEKTILVIKVIEGIEKPYAFNFHSNKPICYVRRDGSNKIAKPEDFRRMCKSFTDPSKGSILTGF